MHSTYAIYYFIWKWFSYSGTGDSLDWYWYNNQEAAGAQMYPTGVHKYFDTFSFTGMVDYLIALIWYEICDWTGIFFLLGLPLDFILDWFAGLSWERALNILWYWVPFGNLFVWFFNIKVQDGWNMM